MFKLLFYLFMFPFYFMYYSLKVIFYIFTFIISLFVKNDTKIQNNHNNHNEVKNTDIISQTHDKNQIKNTEVIEMTDYDDPMYNEIVEFAIQTGKISTSLIQRRFRLGYNRAARIIDLLEERKIIGPANGSYPREVLAIEQIELEENNAIIEDFKKLEENLNYNNTEEILEYLFELEKLNDFYVKLPDNKKELFKEFDNLKINKIRNMLNNKFNKIYESNSKYDLYKSFIEELNYCTKRFPKYENILKSEIIKIENYIEELKNNNFNHSVQSLETIDNLDGLEFEKYIYNLLKNLQYQDLKLTPASNDFGIDILAKKDGVKYAIQCKNYKSSVGSESVQEAYSGKKFYNCHIGIVVTNNYFTNNAKKLAEKNGILLWDRTKLNDLINNVNND